VLAGLACIGEPAVLLDLIISVADQAIKDSLCDDDTNVVILRCFFVFQKSVLAMSYQGRLEVVM